MLKFSANVKTLEWRTVIRYVLVLVVAIFMGTDAENTFAAYGKVPNSKIDSAIMKIDEEKFLGVQIAKDYVLVDASGNEFTIESMLDKPLVLVMSYFSCDGACPAINNTLRATLSEVNAWTLGKDYRVLTVSFDRHDTYQNLEMFIKHAGFKNGLPDGWKMAVMKNPEDIARLTESVGYKYFWEPRDRVFLHPAAFMMLSPDNARVTRYLYAGSISANDIEVSITRAYGSELSSSNVINFLVGACYSYNYADGKYTLNYPIFVAAGALGLGVTSLLGGSILMKRRAKS